MVELKELLHATFPEVTKEEWLKQLEKDLKGTPIQEALEFTDPIEEIAFQSHFHWSESQGNQAAPFSSTRSVRNTNDWVIYQQVSSNDPKAANQVALTNLMQGCSGIGFAQSTDLSARLAEVGLEYIYSDFTTQSKAAAAEIIATLPNSCDAALVCDPLIHGNQAEIIDIFNLAKSNAGLRAFEIDNAVYASAGANSAQQLGIACAQVNAYFQLLTEKGEDANLIADKIQISVGIGANYLFEIAKFRALRLLLDNILDAYGVEAGKQIRIKATSLFLNKSLEDPYTNLLRLTTEGMSAAIGGADIIHLQPYDAWSTNGASAFAYRMSNNISNILKEESFFDKVADAAGGTYAIEQATDKLADAGWTFFQTIESNGGFSSAQTFIQSEIERIAQKRIELFQTKKMKYIGINVFPNPDQSNLLWNVPANAILKPLIVELHKEGGQG